MPSRLTQFATTVALLTVSASAQPAKQYDLVTIKPSPPAAFGSMIRSLMGGKLSLTGVTLRLMISLAYDVRDFQITGEPGWVATDRFDVEANADNETQRIPPEVMRPMLQKLLEDRFQLKIRHDSKEMSIYALVVAKGGAKLEKNVDKPGPMLSMTRGSFSGTKVPVAMIAQQLSQITGRYVADKTDLKGDYDFKLDYTPEQGQGGLIGPPPPPNPNVPAPAADPNSVSIFTALQEQLGLKLDSQKGPVDVLVIDRAEKPSEN